MKRAIVTRADDNVKEWKKLTHPTLKEYSKKCDADFVVISDPAPFLIDDKFEGFRIIEIYNLFEKYDRILHLDTDTLVNKNCPNLFDVVPENMVGCVIEDVGTRLEHRRYQIMKVQEQFGDIGWKNGLINGGIVMMSKQHRDIFSPHEGEYWKGWAGEQTHMSYNINKYKYEVYELDYRWNHMTMFSEKWNGYANRFDSHIIHYAGQGIFDAELVENKLEQAQLDYEAVYGRQNDS